MTLSFPTVCPIVCFGGLQPLTLIWSVLLKIILDNVSPILPTILQRNFVVTWHAVLELAIVDKNKACLASSSFSLGRDQRTSSNV